MKKTLVLSLVYGIMIAGLAFAGDAAADKKKAAEDRKKAIELYQKAHEAHEQATKDFDAAVKLQMTADEDAAMARKLLNEAILLDRDAARDIQVDQLKAEIAGEELRIAHIKNGIRDDEAREKALNTTIAEEQKTIADMQAALKTETKPDSKKLEETVIANDTTDVQNLQAWLKRIQDDVKSDEQQLKGHEAMLASYRKHLKELGG